ncbi:MAG: hypothetical protein JST11_19115 [Acidobacteria bacterium]|nr:hypothetical protein [Acidobacteriota bacterium]
MRSVWTGAACIGAALLLSGVPLCAQLRDNSEKQLTCANSGNDGDRARHCEIREQSLPSVGSLNVDAGPNGGVTVKGWLRADVLVRARIEAAADTEGAAANLASRVTVDGSGGRVRATGPASENRSWWSVGYEIFVPQATDVTVKTHNGGVTVSDVRGRLHVEGINGGVHLTRVAGEITGRTVNGGINVELAGSGFDGRQMELATTNGGVTVTMPPDYSASVHAETGMGRVQSDFPLPPNLANARSQRMEFAIGSGGPPIHIATTNGSIRLKRAQAQ